MRVQSAKAGFVAEEGAAGHGHAARQQNFDGRIKPKDGGAGGAEKFRAARLRIGAASKSEDRTFLQFGSAAESGAKLIGFHLAKGGFAEALEDFGNGEAGGFFDAVIEIDETPGELAGKQSSDGGLAGAHETGETQDLEAGLRPAHRSRSCHAIAARKVNRASRCELYHCRRRVRPWRGRRRRSR